MNQNLFVVRTTTTEYEFRQPKSSPQAILPANTPIRFTLEKAKMKVKIGRQEMRVPRGRFVGTSMPVIVSRGEYSLSALAL